MGAQLSPRLKALVEALPLAPGMRILEVGCGPGAAAREILRRVPDGHVTAIDRSAKAIAQARAASAEQLASGRLALRHVAVEEFALSPGEPPFDLAFAIRVGALDGRHPESERQAKARIAAALAPQARFFVERGNALHEVYLSRASVG